MISKSPFFVVPDFISPLACEDMIESCNFSIPDKDKNLKWVMTHAKSERSNEIIYDRLQPILPTVQEHYAIKYKGMEAPRVEWYVSDTSGDIICENSVYVRRKWLRTKNRDLSAILFLSDYQDVPPLDEDFEVYGGKLEFPQHKFGFNPKRGTLVMFPSVPHFINLTAKVSAGELFQARFHIMADSPLLYEPQKFPGNYTTWFSQQL